MQLEGIRVKTWKEGEVPFVKMIIFALVFCLSSFSFAQDIFDDAETSVENEYDNFEQQEDEEEIENLRELEKFEDIAVIQKKYLDKSGRFEVWGAGSLALNSQFYDFLGLNVALAYHFNESWGLELEGLYLTDLQKNVTTNLEDDQNIVTRSIIVPSYYVGAHLRWSPIYGKISLREKTINPFEMYFTFGGGLSGTDDGQSVPTVHVGTGQVYPITKNTTFRWALSYNFFQANARGDLQGSVSGDKVNTGFLYLSAGVSLFFPFSESR